MLLPASSNSRQTETTLRKISLIEITHSRRTDCSGAHKSVRKRTDEFVPARKAPVADLKNPMKLLWSRPLAMRMLLP
jgi:hypothetical protein